MNFPDFSITTIIGLTGCSILLAASILRILLTFKVSKTFAIFIALCVFVLSYISISGNSINFYLRGIINDLSISSLTLLIHYVISSGNTPTANQNTTRPIFYLVALVGVFFYPVVLGLGPLDPYSSGFINKTQAHFSSFILIFCLTGLMVLSFIKQWNLLLLCLSLSTLAYQLGILESHNLWDYMLDPLLFLYALVAIISQKSKKLLRHFFNELR